MIKKFVSITLLTTLFFSCGKDDNTGDSDSDITEIDTPELTGEFEDTEESKAALEDNAITALEKIEAFNDDTALEKIIELAEYISNNSSTNEDDNANDLIVSETLENISNLSSKSIDIAEFNSVQNSVIANTLEDDYTEATGVYTWSDEEGDFIKTAESDNITYNIDYDGKSAVFTVTEFEATDYVDGEQLPTAVGSNLVIDSQTVFSQTFSSSVDVNKYLPNSYTGKIEIGELSLESAMSNDSNSSVTETVTFKIDSETIVYLGSEVSGDFEDIDTNGDETNDYLEDAFSSSEVTLSFLDADMVMNGAIPSDFNSENEYSLSEQIDLLNENIEIALSVDSKLVANGEFYADTFTNEYVYFDGVNYITEIEEYEDVNIRFLFPDETTADFDTYFNDNFSSVEEKLESVFDLFADKADQTGL